MLREEFEKRTGFYPTLELYEIIEKHYSTMAVDKDEFCKRYKKNTDRLAEQIQLEADEVAWKREQRREGEKRKEIAEKEAEIKDLMNQVETLENQLETELEWKPRGILSKMDQKKYEELEGSGGTKYFNEFEARAWIEKEFGFRRDLIQLITEQKIFEINKYNHLRQTGTVIRKPVYNATDWNYVRFDVRGFQYEVVNGQLEQYV